MDLTYYQKSTERTAVYPEEVGTIYTLFGLFGEVGELADKFKKILRDEIDWDEVDDDITLQEFDDLFVEAIHDSENLDVHGEFGDILWYYARACEELDMHMDAVAEENLTKLLSRKRRDALHGSGDDR